VRGFAFGDRLADDVAALPMAAICPEDTALRIDAGEGAMLFADSLIHYGEVGFVSDRLIGGDSAAVKREAAARVEALLDEPFDTLLFAHGTPLIGGGKEALRQFAARYRDA
jgi:hypothetical protein